jgi:hypothetical protein
LYRDYNETYWEGVGSQDVLKDRTVQVAIGALVVCLIVVAIVLATTTYNEPAQPAAWVLTHLEVLMRSG